MTNMIENAFDEIANNFTKLKQKSSVVEQIAQMWIEALASGNKVIFCGNGGSAADSQHLAAELMGRYKFDRAPMPAMSLTVDTSALTAIGNDYGYDKVFSRQLRGIGNKGDVLVGISTSGNSKNILDAFAKLNENDVPDDGQRFGLVGPHQWNALLNIAEFSNSDYAGDNLPFLKGTESRKWLGINWIMHTGLPLSHLYIVSH